MAKQKCKKHMRWRRKKKAYSNTILPQKTRKISDKQPNLTPKTTRERRKTKAQS